MMGAFGAKDYDVVGEADDADVLVVNTCGFIGMAREASVQAILELAKVKEEKENARLVVTGCLSQRFSDELATSLPEVDLFVGSGSATQIPEFVGELPEEPDPALREPVLRVGKAGTLYDPDTPRTSTGVGYSTYVKVAEGCSQKCTFCIIPRLRGKAKSRSIESVVGEVEKLARAGVREFNIIAQDLTHYGDDFKDEGLTSLKVLLKCLSRVRGARWIRLMYCYPHSVDAEFLELMATEKSIVPYMDIPLQHIDDEVLARMQRRVGEGDTRELMDAMREKVPGIFLRTTFLVGFPGETRKHMKNLLEYARDFEFDHAGAFAFSFEKGTRSARMDQQVPERTARRRADRLGQVLQESAYQRAISRVGEIHEAVIEDTGPYEGLYVGRHWGQAPEIDGKTILHWSGEPLLPGTFVRIELTHVTEVDLEGDVLEILELPAS